MSNKSPALVVVGHLHPLVLRGLAWVLEEDRRFQLLAVGLVGADLEHTIGDWLPSIVVLGDLFDPAMLARVTSSRAAPAVLVLTHDPPMPYRDFLSAAGANCLDYNIPVEQLMDELYISALSSQAGSSDDKRDGKQSMQDRLATLTERENAVFESLDEGASNAHIALRVGISEGTVKTHLAKLRRKLEVASRRELVALSLVARQFRALG